MPVAEIVAALSVVSTVQSIYGLFNSVYLVVRNATNLLSQVEEVGSFVSICREVERSLRNQDAALRQAVENGLYLNGDTYFRLTMLLGNLRGAKEIVDKMANRTMLRNMMPGSEKLRKLRGLRTKVFENVTMLMFHFTVGPPPTGHYNREQRVRSIQPSQQQIRTITQPTPQLDLVPVYPGGTSQYAANYQFASPFQSYHGQLEAAANYQFASPSYYSYYSYY